MCGPPLYDVCVVEAGRVAERAVAAIRAGAAVAARSVANPSRLPPTVSAIAYAASFAETIIIEASISSNGHGLATGRPMRIVSTVASRALAVTSAPGHSRSTAVRAVMILAVLAGWKRLVDVVADQDPAGAGVDDDVGLGRAGARRPPPGRAGVSRSATDDRGRADERGEAARAAHGPPA